MSKRKPDPKSPLRNRERLHKHRYGENRRGNGRGYSVEEIRFFLSLNKKDERGRYEHTDVHIAQMIKCSLATVQYLRRKFNMIKKMKLSDDKALELMRVSERTIRALSQH